MSKKSKNAKLSQDRLNAKSRNAARAAATAGRSRTFAGKKDKLAKQNADPEIAEGLGEYADQQAAAQTRVRRNGLGMDSDAEEYDAGEHRFTNYYRHCDTDWNDPECNSMHNDRCPKCNAEIQPYFSQENETGEIIVHNKEMYDASDEKIITIDEAIAKLQAAKRICGGDAVLILSLSDSQLNNVNVNDIVPIKDSPDTRYAEVQVKHSNLNEMLERLERLTEWSNKL